MADLGARLVGHLRWLTVEIDELAAEITSRTTVLAPSVLAILGCAPFGRSEGPRREASRSVDSTPRMHLPDTTELHRYRCGRRIMRDIDSHTPETGKSTPAFIGSL